MPRSLFSLVALLLAIPVWAQSEPTLVTDRPDQTESTNVVAAGRVQIEAGTLYADHGAEQSWDHPAALARIGIGRRLELRLASAVTSTRTSDSDWHTRISGVDAGVKLYLFDARGARPETALLASVGMPVGEDDVQAGDAGFGAAFRFTCAHALGDETSLGYNLGAAWDDVARGGALVYTATVGRSLAGPLSGFAEVFGEASADVAWLAADAGVTYVLRPNLQFDASFGRGLSGEGPGWFLSSGASVRLPR